MKHKRTLEFPIVWDFSAIGKKDFILFQPPINTVELRHFAPTWTYMHTDKETKAERMLVTHVQIEKKSYPKIASLSAIMDEAGRHIPIYTTVIPIDRVGRLLHGCYGRAYRRGYRRGKKSADRAQRILSRITSNTKIGSKYPPKRKNLTALSKLSKIAHMD